MDCKSFTNKHAAFLDDTLPGVDMTEMRDHLGACARCARRDADVRRALLLVRNLPPARVSEGFQERLRARLVAEEGRPVSQPRQLLTKSSLKWAAAAACILAVAGVATRNGAEAGNDSPMRLPAVVASSPGVVLDSVDDSAPAYLASMSTGIPMWPALMLAEEGPLRFAAVELQNAVLDAARPH